MKQNNKENKTICCKNCKFWKTPIAYVTTGKCSKDKRITNKNFSCGEGCPKK